MKVFTFALLAAVVTACDAASPNPETQETQLTTFIQTGLSSIEAQSSNLLQLNAEEDSIVPDNFTKCDFIQEQIPPQITATDEPVILRGKTAPKFNILLFKPSEDALKAALQIAEGGVNISKMISDNSQETVESAKKIFEAANTLNVKYGIDAAKTYVETAQKADDVAKETLKKATAILKQAEADKAAFIASKDAAIRATKVSQNLAVINTATSKQLLSVYKSILAIVTPTAVQTEIATATSSLALVQAGADAANAASLVSKAVLDLENAGDGDEDDEEQAAIVALNVAKIAAQAALTQAQKISDDYQKLFEEKKIDLEKAKKSGTNTDKAAAQATFAEVKAAVDQASAVLQTVQAALNQAGKIETPKEAQEAGNKSAETAVNMAQILASQAKEALKLANTISAQAKSKKAANLAATVSLAKEAQAASVSANAALLKVKEEFKIYSAKEAVIETAIEALKTVETAVNVYDKQSYLKAEISKTASSLKTEQAIAQKALQNLKVAQSNLDKVKKLGVKNDIATAKAALATAQTAADAANVALKAAQTASDQAVQASNDGKKAFQIANKKAADAANVATAANTEATKLASQLATSALKPAEDIAKKAATDDKAAQKAAKDAQTKYEAAVKIGNQVIIDAASAALAKAQAAATLSAENLKAATAASTQTKAAGIAAKKAYDSAVKKQADVAKKVAKALKDEVPIAIY